MKRYVCISTVRLLLNGECPVYILLPAIRSHLKIYWPQGKYDFMPQVLSLKIL